MSLRKCFDCLVIGSGIAGLCTAIKAAESGLKVAVLSKEADLNICNTNHAQGGIVATNPVETAMALEKDILRAGDYANYLEAVRYISEQGAPLIEPFSRQDGRAVLQKRGWRIRPHPRRGAF